MKQKKLSAPVKFLAIPTILLLIAAPLAVPDTLAGVKDVAKEIWQKLWPWAKQGYLTVKDLVKERKSIIEKEFEREKQEVKEDLKLQLLKIPQSFWERIKWLVR